MNSIPEKKLVEAKTSGGNSTSGLPALPDLPDAETVSTAIRSLASGDPRFAALLQQGVPQAEALARLGQQLFLEHRFAEAAALFQLAVTLAPNNSVLWTNYGTALDCAGSFAEAAACLQHSLAISPEQPDTWLLLGLVKKKTGDLEGCEHAYRTALRQSPKSSAVWECLALLQEERREYAEAIDSLESATKLGSANAAIAANLGKLCYQLGRTHEACDAYDRAVRSEPGNAHYQQMARKAAFVRDLLRGQSVDDALAAYERSMAAAKQEHEPATEPNTEKERLDLLQAAFGQLSGFGYLDAASRVGEKYLQLRPHSAEVAYLMKAIKGESSLARSPEDYIAEHFDSFADGFDAKLVGVLGYDVPEKLCSAVRRITPAGQKYIALDAGCGTGLCGPILRPFVNQLTGVDLAPKMLEQAAKRGVYDQLLCEELISFLNRSPLRFDLVVAADVAIYIGDLLPVFTGAANAMQPGGILAFSTEFWSGEGYRLQPSGRFAHPPAYVRSLAAPHFREQICERTTIRLEAGSRVPGHLFVFVKNALQKCCAFATGAASLLLTGGVLTCQELARIFLAWPGVFGCNHKECFRMKRNLLAAISICVLAGAIAGCSHKNADPSSGANSAPAGDRDAVVAAIQKHLATDSGVNMSAMNMTVNGVDINGDQAQADAEFHLKEGGQSMRITYQLQRQAGDWVVLSDTPGGGGQFSHPPMDKNHPAASSPDSAEPLPDATDYLKNHAPPAKQ